MWYIRLSVICIVFTTTLHVPGSLEANHTCMMTGGLCCTYPVLCEGVNHVYLGMATVTFQFGEREMTGSTRHGPQRGGGWATLAAGARLQPPPEPYVHWQLTFLLFNIEWFPFLLSLSGLEY